MCSAGKQRLFCLAISSGVAIALATVARAASVPAWYQDTVRKDGTKLTVNCMGSGPDQSTAAILSSRECQAIAIEHVRGYQVNARSLVVETNEQVALHSEISSDLKVAGLSCNPIHQQAIENGAGGFDSYLQCQYDLKGARAVPIAKPKRDSESQDSTGLVKRAERAEGVSGDQVVASQRHYIQSEARQLILTSIPKADRIIIVSKCPRVIAVKSNPTTLILHPSDSELILEAQGFLSKHIFLNSIRKPANDASDAVTDEIEVQLEKP